MDDVVNIYYKENIIYISKVYFVRHLIQVELLIRQCDIENSVTSVIDFPAQCMKTRDCEWMLTSVCHASRLLQ